MFTGARSNMALYLGSTIVKKLSVAEQHCEEVTCVGKCANSREALKSEPKNMFSNPSRLIRPQRQEDLVGVSEGGVPQEDPAQQRPI